MRFVFVSLLTAWGVSGAPPDPKLVDFTRDIRPLLSDKCFACHGPDDKSRMANLRLDTKDGAFAERKNYHIIKSGDSAASRVYLRVSTQNKATRMPPRGVWTFTHGS